MNASLMAPLDVARFALAYLVVVCIPGYAVAVVARPRAPLVERLALAIPCAYSLVALSGLATALAGLPYGLPAYAALAVPAVAAAVYTSWRRRSMTPVTTDATNDGRWWLVAAGVAIVQAAVLGAVFAGYVAPPNGDAVSHVQWTTMVARAHVFPLALLSAHAGDASGGFYPPVFHVLTALVLGVAPMSPIHAVFYSVLATAVVLPLAWIIHENIYRHGLAADGGFHRPQSPLWVPKSVLEPIQRPKRMNMQLDVAELIRQKCS